MSAPKLLQRSICTTIGSPCGMRHGCVFWRDSLVRRSKRRDTLKHSTGIRRFSSLPPLLQSDTPSPPTSTSSSTTPSTISTDPTPTDFAILGGGITGLATAYYLSKELPQATIRLFEASERCGGWVKSDSAVVGDGQSEASVGEVLFERGPRSLRPGFPNGALGLQLANELDLNDDLLITHTTAPAAQRRYVYYPDHLVRMPGPGMGFGQLVSTLTTESVFRGLIPAMLREAWVPQRDPSLADESVGGFISRRLNSDVADNLASALFHGIYAGDVYQLSMKSILPLIWAREGKEGSMAGAAAKAIFKQGSWEFMDDIMLTGEMSAYQWDPELRKQLQQSAVYSFQYGIEQLTVALEATLSARPNVHIHKSTSAVDTAPTEGSDDILLSVSSNTPSDSPSQFRAKNIVSTIPSPASAFLTPTFTTHPTPAVTVAVVNLYYPPSHPDLPQIIPSSKYPALQGFGYLIPASVPFAQNPERALGVVFDSDIAPEAYSTVPPTELGTRLTVMLGGHWWDGWEAVPTETDCADMAQAVLARHLGIMTKPAVCQTTLQRDCIPQYTVGHSARMLRAHEDLLKRWKGRVRVAGSWFTGVGVNDCLRSAYDIAKGFKLEEGFSRKERITGLERVAKKRPMGLVRKSVRDGVKTFEVVETD